MGDIEVIQQKIKDLEARLELRMDTIRDDIKELQGDLESLDSLVHKRINKRKQEIQQLSQELEDVSGATQYHRSVWTNIWAVMKYVITAAAGILTWLLRDLILEAIGV